jgi:hypothetical protein
MAAVVAIDALLHQRHLIAKRLHELTALLNSLDVRSGDFH